MELAALNYMEGIALKHKDTIAKDTKANCSRHRISLNIIPHLIDKVAEKYDVFDIKVSGNHVHLVIFI